MTQRGGEAEDVNTHAPCYGLSSRVVAHMGRPEERWDEMAGGRVCRTQQRNGCVRRPLCVLNSGAHFNRVWESLS